MISAGVVYPAGSLSFPSALSCLITAACISLDQSPLAMMFVASRRLVVTDRMVVFASPSRVVTRTNSPQLKADIPLVATTSRSQAPESSTVLIVNFRPSNAGCSASRTKEQVAEMEKDMSSSDGSLAIDATVVQPAPRNTVETTTTTLATWMCIRVASMVTPNIHVERRAPLGMAALYPSRVRSNTLFSRRPGCSARAADHCCPWPAPASTNRPPVAEE